jgi:hypothetical protein
MPLLLLTSLVAMTPAGGPPAFDPRLFHNPPQVTCPEGQPNFAPGTVISHLTICPYSLTPPSLWLEASWIPPQILLGWLTTIRGEHSPGWVDLVVDADAWAQLGYLERYRFLSRFGQIATQESYNLRLFTPEGEPLGTYLCRYRDSRRPQGCQVQLDYQGRP